MYSLVTDCYDIKVSSLSKKIRAINPKKIPSKFKGGSIQPCVVVRFFGVYS